MRLLLITLITIVNVLAVRAQNHVPNPSFEQHSACPTVVAQMQSRCNVWDTVTSSSPEYFNACSNTTVSVPTNIFGYQHAASGQAYVGIVTYYNNIIANFREYLKAPITPLVVGSTYRVSMSVSFANNYNYATNGLGILFYDTGYAGVTVFTLPSYTPQISYNSYGTITDTLNWVRLSKTFVADSTYDNIIVGCFLNDSQIDIDTVKTTANSVSYYLLDSIVVEQVFPFTSSVQDTSLCAGDTFQVSYDVATSYSSNNTFTAQLSDGSGSFSSPVNIGSIQTDTTDTITCVVPLTVSPDSGYKIRVISSNSADTSSANNTTLDIGNLDSANIQVSSNSPACSGDSVKFLVTHSANSISSLWNGPNSFTSTVQSPYITNAAASHAGNYYSQITTYGCVKLDTLAVVVNTSPLPPTLTSNSPVCAGDTLKLNASNNSSGVSFSWAGPNSFSANGQNIVIANSLSNMSGVYTCSVTLNGCVKSDTVSVFVLGSPTGSTISSNSPLCAGDTLKLSTSNTNVGVNYSWYGPSNFVSTSSLPTINNVNSTSSGWYKVTLSLNNCSLKDSTYVLVNNIPQKATITYNGPLCLGEKLQMLASSVSGVSYEWAGPNAFSAVGQGVSRSNVSFSDTGYYYVKTKAANCSSDADSLKVIVKPLPFVVISSTPDSSCKGVNVIFSAYTGNTGSFFSYQWYKDNSPVSSANSNTYRNAGLSNNDIIYCEITDRNSCSNTHVDKSNVINAKVLAWKAPSAHISSSPVMPVKAGVLVTFIANVQDAGLNPKFQWFKNGVSIVGATSKIWSAATLNDNDEISVEVVSDYYCAQPSKVVSNKIKSQIVLSVYEPLTLENVILYPNPTYDRLYVEGVEVGSKIEILNLYGTVINEVVVTSNNRVEFDLKEAPSACYVIRVSNFHEGHVKVIRFNKL